MPISQSCWNTRAAWPERVNTAAPFAYGFALTRRIASSSDSERTTHSTGPKISSR